MTAEGGRRCHSPEIDPGVCDAYEGSEIPRECPPGQCIMRAAQPSESEREGARLACLWPKGHVGSHDFVNARAGEVTEAVCGAPPSPPSTGQSREQRLEEALRGLLEAEWMVTPDWTSSDKREAVLEAARRALESKP
jgi:hypothetical protein